jgi:hypothetical protein
MFTAATRSDAPGPLFHPRDSAFEFATLLLADQYSEAALQKTRIYIN